MFASRSPVELAQRLARLWIQQSPHRILHLLEGTPADSHITSAKYSPYEECSVPISAYTTLLWLKISSAQTQRLHRKDEMGKSVRRCGALWRVDTAIQQRCCGLFKNILLQELHQSG
jgi:hypothetical protein